MDLGYMYLVLDSLSKRHYNFTASLILIECRIVLACECVKKQAITVVAS